MWFIIPVKEISRCGWRREPSQFLRTDCLPSEQPLGLIAYLDREPVGWCAAGPRSRYDARARCTDCNGYKGRDPDEDEDVWLLPCLFVREDARKSDLSEQLVRSAVRLAKEHGAVAIEAFPYSRRKRQNKETQVGFEAVFSTCGFAVIGRPSANRVVMRLELQDGDA